jgi:hypothetical protein
MSKRKPTPPDESFTGDGFTDRSVMTGDIAAVAISRHVGSEAGWNAAIDAAAKRIHDLSGHCDNVKTAFYLKDEVLKLKR